MAFDFEKTPKWFLVFCLSVLLLISVPAVKLTFSNTQDNLKAQGEKLKETTALAWQAKESAERAETGVQRLELSINEIKVNQEKNRVESREDKKDLEKKIDILIDRKRN